MDCLGRISKQQVDFSNWYGRFPWYAKGMEDSYNSDGKKPSGDQSKFLHSWYFIGPRDVC